MKDEKGGAVDIVTEEAVISCKRHDHTKRVMLPAQHPSGPPEALAEGRRKLLARARGRWEEMARDGWLLESVQLQGAGGVIRAFKNFEEALAWLG